ncbi:MAG: ATP-binding protein, partial [bacterium]|nr:ATP-binding protein [bacterium]
LGAKWVNFWELTPEKTAVYITAHYGMKPEYAEQSKQHPIGLGKAWIGRTVKTGKAWATSDVLTDPKMMKELGITWKKTIEKQDYRALLCAPTISMRGPVGGICVYYPDVHQFTDFEMRLVTVAANQAATAITNTQIFNELAAEKNKTFATIQSLQDGLIMYDLEEKVVFFNPKAEELLLLAAKDVIGKKIEEDFQQKGVYWKNLYNIKNLAQKEYSFKEYATEGPKKLNLEIVYIPVRDQNYQKIGAMQILRNITREKELELLKAGFVSTASHQLRTPLSSIKWALNVLIKEEPGSLNQEQKDILKKTFIVNERLIQLIADLLDTSKVEEGKLDYKFILGDLSQLVKKIFNEKKMDAKRRNLNFIFKKPLAPLPKISFDANKLGIAIRNIINNAIRYTPVRGSVEIELRPEKYSLLLIIKDTGIGVPKESQRFIFVKFFRAENAIRFQTEGSGLGLFIAKSIVEKHNAILSFESEKNKGSVFIFQFPLEPKRMPKV